MADAADSFAGMVIDMVETAEIAVTNLATATGAGLTSQGVGTTLGLVALLGTVFSSDDAGPNAGDIDVVSPGQLANAGIDAEALKDDYVQGQGSKYNVAVGPNGEVILVPVKPGTGPNIPTGLNIDELPDLYPSEGTDDN